MRTIVRTALLCLTLAYAIHAVKIGTTRPTPTTPTVSFVRVEPTDPVITVETEYGIATITGPAAEYVLESAFPIVLE